MHFQGNKQFTVCAELQERLESFKTLDDFKEASVVSEYLSPPQSQCYCRTTNHNFALVKEGLVPFCTRITILNMSELANSLYR